MGIQFNFMALFLQTNFQTILATDERITFVIFLYDEDILDIAERFDFTAGFDAGDDIRELSFPLGLQERVYRIDGLLLLAQDTIKPLISTTPK